MKRFARFFIAAALVCAGLFAAAPALTASASSNDVVVTWVTDISSTTVTYSCDATSYSMRDGANISFVANGCGDRVWLHQRAGGGGSAPYCINPGAVASGFGVFLQFQVTNNPNPCDVGAQVDVTYYVPDYATQYDCLEGAFHFESDQYGDPYVINTLANHCNTRVWLYYNSNGSGGVTCVSPYSNYTEDVYNPRYYISISANQANC